MCGSFKTDCKPYHSTALINDSIPKSFQIQIPMLSSFGLLVTSSKTHSKSHQPFTHIYYCDLWVFQVIFWKTFPNKQLISGLRIIDECHWEMWCNFAGFAYVGGACVVNKRLEKVNSVAIIEDTGGFSGIIVAAHEVGHLWVQAPSWRSLVTLMPFFYILQARRRARWFTTAQLLGWSGSWEMPLGGRIHYVRFATYRTWLPMVPMQHSKLSSFPQVR